MSEHFTLVKSCVSARRGSLQPRVRSRTVHMAFLPRAPGIPEDRQPAAWNHRPGETWLQTLPPGEKSFRGSSVPSREEASSPAGARAQPQPREVSSLPWGWWCGVDPWPVADVPPGRWQCGGQYFPYLPNFFSRLLPQPCGGRGYLPVYTSKK